jgi:hypothetical protein
MAKGLTIVLLLLSFNCFSQSINSPLSHDKQKHILIGAGIGFATLPFTKGKTDFQRVLIGSGIATGTAFGYEVYQGISQSGSVEALDVVYTGAGALVSTFITLKLNKAIFRRSKRRSTVK